MPDVKGLKIEEAAAFFQNNHLRYNVIDSVFSKDVNPGAIVELEPSVGSKVKEGRIIYLTINTLNTPLQVVPDIADNSSMRQAQARLLASGFKLAENEYVSGEKDWVYGVKYRGRRLANGEKVPVGATLTLMVGNGSGIMGRDSLEIEIASATESNTSGNSAADETWF